jgi:hypothetical protein
MCDVIGPWKPPHFSALPLLACPRDARPHEPLCCCCRCSLSAPVAVPQVTTVRLASASAPRAAIIDDTHAACLQTPPRHTNAAAALVLHCALLPLPARKPFHCLDGSTPGIYRVVAPACTASPSSSPSRLAAGPRKRDRGHFLPASTRPHRSNVNVKSSHAQQHHPRLDTTPPHCTILAPPLIAKLSLASPAPHSLRPRRWSTSASVVLDRLSLFRLARVFAIAFFGSLCTSHLTK